MPSSEETRDSSTDGAASSAAGSDARDAWTRFLVHDMRGPITAVITGIATLQTTAELTEDDRALCEQMVHELQRLASLVNDLLDHDRLRTGRLRPRVEAADLSALARDVGDRASLLARLRGLQFELRSAPDRVVAPADASLLQRVLENLVSNALRHAHRQVALEVSQENGRVLFRVLNDGSPVPPEIAGRIFEPYVQITGLGPIGGSGLGLPFCREVMRALGGTIQLEQRQGLTCFAVGLDAPRSG